MTYIDIKNKITAGDFDSLVGLVEDEHFEVKSGKYDFSSEGGKQEFAKDVSNKELNKNHMLNLRNEFINKTICLFGLIVFASCKCQQNDDLLISKDEMLRIVKSCDNQFRIGIQKKDSVMLTNIYSDSAQYVQPKRPIIKGKTEIGKDWGGFIKMKENPIDLVLNINDVRGNREIIYETGYGYTLLADSTKWNFNYVNVWRLQKDGSYKLEVDTYN